MENNSLTIIKTIIFLWKRIWWHLMKKNYKNIMIKNNYARMCLEDILYSIIRIFAKSINKHK